MGGEQFASLLLGLLSTFICGVGAGAGWMSVSPGDRLAFYYRKICAAGTHFRTVTKFAR